MSNTEITTLKELRFVVHVEDDPAVLQNEFDSYKAAAEACKDLVSMRINQNGCGNGLVFDRVEDSVVAVFRHGQTPEAGFGFLAPPSLVESEELSQAFRPWLNSSSISRGPNLIWRTSF